MKDAVDCAKWFIENNPFLSADRFGNKENNLKIEKLLYYANVILVILKKHTLFREDIVAYREGFVVEDLYRRFRTNSEEVYNYSLTDDFTDDEKLALNLSNVLFGKLTGYELSHMVHMDDIWAKYEEDSCRLGSHRSLENDDIINFYTKQKNFMENIKYCIQNLETEKAKMENLVVRKVYKSDNVFFYHDRKMEIGGKDLELLQCLSEENGDLPETKYYYLFKDNTGELNVE